MEIPEILSLEIGKDGSHRDYSMASDEITRRKCRSSQVYIGIINAGPRTATAVGVLSRLVETVGRWLVDRYVVLEIEHTARYCTASIVA